MNPHTRRLRKHRRKERRLDAERGRKDLEDFNQAAARAVAEAARKASRLAAQAARKAAPAAIQPKSPPPPASGGALLVSMLSGTLPKP